MFSAFSAIAGIVSLFLNDLFAMAVAFSAVLLAFFASRRKEKYYMAGMLVGALVLIFVNLQNLDILKSNEKKQVETIYNSLRLSNQVHGMLGGENKDEMLTIFDQLLRSAGKVDTDLVNHLLPGFKSHFESEYIEGFTLLKEGIANSDTGKKLQGAVLVDSWAKWNIEHKEMLEKVRLKKPSLAAFIFKFRKTQIPRH